MQQKGTQLCFFVLSKVFQLFWNFGKWNCFKLRVDSLQPPMNNSAEIQGFLFLNVKILQIEAPLFEIFFLFWILNLIHSNCYKWAANFSKMPDEFEIRFWFSKESVYFRWFAFENTNLVDAKFHIFQNFRNLWFWNFYFRWFDIIEKMSDFDGWPSVG